MTSPIQPQHFKAVLDDLSLDEIRAVVEQVKAIKGVLGIAFNKSAAKEPADVPLAIIVTCVGEDQRQEAKKIPGIQAVGPLYRTRQVQ